MIHDILLSLSGLVGRSFELEAREFVHDTVSLYSYKYSLKLKPSVEDCLSETEKRLVERILSISSNFYSVNEFVKSVQNSLYLSQKSLPSSSLDDDENSILARVDLKKRLLKIHPVGLYIQAVASCMQEYILKFLEKINQLELGIFENPSLPLTFILTSISKPARVLEQFMTFIDEWHDLALNSRVDSNSQFSFSNMMVSLEANSNSYQVHVSVPCGILLDLFYLGTTTGDSLQEAVSRNFLLACCRVFCYQMVNWVVLGKLVDPFEEFIVGKFSIAGVVGHACSSAILPPPSDR